METLYMQPDKRAIEPKMPTSGGQDFGKTELIHMDFLLSAIPGAVLVYDIYDGRFNVITCSRGLTKLVGWEPEEFRARLADPAFQKIYPADEALFRATMEKIVQTKSRGDLMYRGYKKDGSILWLWLQGHFIGEKDGHVYVEVLLLDASDTAGTYQTMLDQTQSLVTVVDAQTFEVLYANQVAKDTVGQLRPGDYLGSVCYQHVMHYDKPCPFCIVNNADTDSWVDPLVELSGRFYRQVFKKIQWHGREALLEFSTDITDQVENLAMLNRQRKMNATILDAIPAGIMVFKLVDDRIEIVSANKGICAMAGMDGVKAVGKGNKEIFDLTHPEDRKIVADAAAKLRTPNSYVEYEYRQYYPSREKYVWVLGQGHSEINPEDGCVYAYISYTDITSRKEVEELQEKLKVAEIEASTKTEFYSQMSHDMRTPMNGILGLARLALAESDPAQVHRDIEQILQSGNYMLGLINDTLDLQRLETGNLTLEPKVVNRQDLFADICEIIRPAIAEKNLHFDFRLPDAVDDPLSRYVRIDPLRFKQILINLLSNSVKFTPPGGDVCLQIKEVRREGRLSENAITVTDTGIGMGQAFLSEKLFKPFSQETSSAGGKYGGSGLGLSIVKRLVDLMGGRIEVSSEPGEGTAFTIYFAFELVPPEEAKRLQEVRLNEEEESKHSLEGKHVLLCEDHPLNAEITKRLLRTRNCTVDWAADGQDGVRLFRESVPGQYDAVLMDIRMPVMDGLAATKAIRLSDHPDAQTIPIIAMSANAYKSDIQKSLSAGMNDHLAKPVIPENLFDTLAKYMA